MAAYYVPVLIIKINICRPIAAYWDPSVPAHCLNQRAVLVADTVVSAVTDLAVLLAPAPVIRAIKMSCRQKFRVYLLLGAGGVATVASFVRIYLVVQLQKSDDQTVDFVRFNLLGYKKTHSLAFCILSIHLITFSNRTAEVSIGLACACMPTISQLYQSRNKSDQRHRPRSRIFGIRTPKFLKRKGEGRQWWPDGVSTTQTTFATSDINFRAKIDSIPVSVQDSSTRGTREPHFPASRIVAPLSTLITSSQGSSWRLSTRTKSRSTLPMGSSASRDRSPPIRLENIASHGTDISCLSGLTVQGDMPSSPGWPFPRAARTLSSRALTASLEPLYARDS